MAIDDIVARIRADVQAEAAAIVAEATAEAARLGGDAQARAEAEAARMLAGESARARRDAETLVAGARLAARDALLDARLTADHEALARAEAALVALADDVYVAMLARHVAESATGGETVLLGSADADRLRRTLPAALSAAGAPALPIGDAPAGIERGLVLAGDRIRVEVSAAAMIAGRREELLALADAELFGEGE